MKLLFDQNISPKIVRQVSSSFPDSTQVRFIGLEDSSDLEIFNFGKTNGFTIVTFDVDFVDLNAFRGIPPKIIWLKTGNMATLNIAEILKRNIKTIEEFVVSELDEILEIG